MLNIWSARWERVHDGGYLEGMDIRGRHTILYKLHEAVNFYPAPISLATATAALVI